MEYASYIYIRKIGQHKQICLVFMAKLIIFFCFCEAEINDSPTLVAPVTLNFFLSFKQSSCQ